MTETKHTRNSIWITNGEENIMFTKDTVEQYLLENPEWRKGRSNAFTYINRTRKKNRIKPMENKLFLGVVEEML